MTLGQSGSQYSAHGITDRLNKYKMLRQPGLGNFGAKTGVTCVRTQCSSSGGR